MRLILHDGAWPKAIWVLQTWVPGLKSCTGVLDLEIALVQGSLRLP